MAASDIRAATDTGNSHCRKPHNSKSKRFCGTCPMCELKAMPQSIAGLQCSKQEMHVERLGQDRTGPTSVVCSAVATNHSANNSQRRLLTKWQTVRTLSFFLFFFKWQDKLTCIKSMKSSILYISMYTSCRIYTYMDITTTTTIAAVMGKGRDDKLHDRTPPLTL